MLSRSLRVLLEGSVDYAGLFPPAGLQLQQAIAIYQAYQSSPFGWMLGHFVLRADQLSDFEACCPQRKVVEPWPLSVVLGPRLGPDIDRLVLFNERNPWALVDTVEARAESAEEIIAICSHVPEWLSAYVEIPIQGDLPRLIGQLARWNLHAMVRTGGRGVDDLPSAQRLASFAATCIDSGVQFKASLGLHQPLRVPGAARHGFLNLLLATALLYNGCSTLEAVRLLDEAGSSAFDFGEQSCIWSGYRFGLDGLVRMRQLGMNSFSSCSLTDPVEGLRAMGLA